MLIRKSLLLFKVGKKVIYFGFGFTTDRIAFGVQWLSWLNFDIYFGPFWLSFEIIPNETKEDANCVYKALRYSKDNK